MTKEKSYLLDYNTLEKKAEYSYDDKELFKARSELRDKEMEKEGEE
jgi:hypothetical protein